MEPIDQRNTKNTWKSSLQPAGIPLVIVCLVFFISCSIHAQARQLYNKTDMITKVLDSLSVMILSDTAKYARKDLIHTSLLTENSSSYSPLFVVDDKYLYILDIVNGSAVAEFVNEFLVASKISSMRCLKASEGTIIYGKRAQNGVVYLNTKKVKVNYRIAGLATRRKNNFYQHVKGELWVNH